MGNKQVIDRQRLFFFALVLSCIAALYLLKLFQMQVLDGYIYLHRAQTTAQRSEPIFAQRGQIFDRHYDQPLATNRNSFAITIVPADLPRGEQREIIEELARLLNRDPLQVLERYRTTARGLFVPVEVISNLTLEDLTLVAERIDSFPGVSWYSKPERVYPAGALASNVVGYVGDITPQELQVLFNEGYTSSSIIGKSGIEQRYDQHLRGTDGRRVRLVDARGRHVRDGDELILPDQGSNLVLTIDARLQRLVQEALGPRIGSAVVMRPATGEILSLVTYPRYDPNLFIGPGGDVEFRRLSRDRRAPFLNRPVQSAAAPASVFKILMNIAIMEEDAFPRNETIQCTGEFPYGNRVFHDWLESGHGPVDITAALAQSCNIFYYTIGAHHLSVDQIIDYSYRLGFGSVTGIDVRGEHPGLVPSPAWKEQNRGARWVGGDTVNFSIGQGYLQVTPLQVASMVATIVNDGVTYRPHLLREIRDPLTGTLIERQQPEVVRRSDISAETFREVRAQMRAVITEGTAEVVIINNAVEIAGKTGTGQIGIAGRHHSWFAAYGPYGEDVPPEEQIVVVVMVDAANEWEWWAPKASNIIFHGHFRGLDYAETVADLRRGPRYLWY
ncbi:hypothetical protein AU468_01715 [Alkalispirochaeta sphaeroplastigenens]|uniref:Penicillin-binding protein 2 n=1 Tax=Alkalispirochaeta sphaeroplastigenens TaxID=1187066 RepID=A0A2S4K0D4_9SPIO|nr:penicillin-binding protein 2 [Alkalispirochaeta sphaeroplastigenens]POR05230.1 hypothetical protein AU468_01715 [Alkalispirochaeta sphaeroplastigenens]